MNCPAIAPRTNFDAATSPTAFEIGWDFARHRLVPPADHLHAGHPVRQGWEAGQAVFGTRTREATPHVRKWLQLRLGAWLRGKAFEGVGVTPAFLRRIDVPACSITGELLTHATGKPSDASVDRVNNAAGYAVGNLAVMSRRANEAKSDYAWDDAARFARQVVAGRLGTIDGLDAAQWARLSVLMSFATPLPHATAASLPLLLLPTPRLRVLNPAQGLQLALTSRFLQSGQPARVDRVAAWFPKPARASLLPLMTLLLARRIAAGPCPSPQALVNAMTQAWVQPRVLHLWRATALALAPEDCERILQRLVAHRLAPTALRCMPVEQATEGWALDSGGRMPLNQAALAFAGAPHAMAA